MEWTFDLDALWTRHKGIFKALLASIAERLVSELQEFRISVDPPVSRKEIGSPFLESTVRTGRRPFMLLRTGIAPEFPNEAFAFLSAFLIGNPAAVVYRESAFVDSKELGHEISRWILESVNARSLAPAISAIVREIALAKQKDWIPPSMNGPDTSELDIERLVTMLVEHEITSEYLDEMVHDLKGYEAADKLNELDREDPDDVEGKEEIMQQAEDEASRINNGGLADQVEYIVSVLGLKEAGRQLAKIAGSESPFGVGPKEWKP